MSDNIYFLRSEAAAAAMHLTLKIMEAHPHLPRLIAEESASEILVRQLAVAYNGRQIHDRVFEWDSSEPSDATVGSGPQGILRRVEFATLSTVLGEPAEYLIGKNETKIDVQWEIDATYLLDGEFKQLTFAVYNWKNGPNYCGPGAKVEYIDEWTIAASGPNRSDAQRILEMILEKGER